jgi:hypothetical protein
MLPPIDERIPLNRIHFLTPDSGESRSVHSRGGNRAGAVRGPYRPKFLPPVYAGDGTPAAARFPDGPPTTIITIAARMPSTANPSIAYSA